MMFNVICAVVLSTFFAVLAGLIIYLINGDAR